MAAQSCWRSVQLDSNDDEPRGPTARAIPGRQKTVSRSPYVSCTRRKPSGKIAPVHGSAIATHSLGAVYEEKHGDETALGCCSRFDASHGPNGFWSGRCRCVYNKEIVGHASVVTLSGIQLAVARMELYRQCCPQTQDFEQDTKGQPILRGFAGRCVGGSSRTLPAISLLFSHCPKAQCAKSR
jgi:hypothetical protein